MGALDSGGQDVPEKKRTSHKHKMKGKNGREGKKGKY